MSAKLNKVFTITKGNRSMRWKIVIHPYHECYAIVRDHSGLHGAMRNGPCNEEDLPYIMYGGNTLDEAYKTAYDCT